MRLELNIYNEGTLMSHLSRSITISEYQMKSYENIYHYLTVNLPLFYDVSKNNNA